MRFQILILVFKGLILTFFTHPKVLYQRSNTAAIVGLVPNRSCCIAAFAVTYDLYQGFGTCISLVD